MYPQAGPEQITIYPPPPPHQTMKLPLHAPSFSLQRHLLLKGEVKAKIKISPVVVFGVLSRMVVARGS